MDDWIKNIKIGDILLSGRNTVRVVRRVTKSKKYDRLSVAFLINRCSWTGRCYTVYTNVDLKILGYKPTGVNIKLDSDFDVAVEKEINFKDCRDPVKIKCCDVTGIP